MKPGTAAQFLGVFCALPAQWASHRVESGKPLTVRQREMAFENLYLVSLGDVDEAQRCVEEAMIGGRLSQREARFSVIWSTHAEGFDYHEACVKSECHFPSHQTIFQILGFQVELDSMLSSQSTFVSPSIMVSSIVVAYTLN